MKIKYEVVCEGWLDGVWRAKGEPLMLTPEEAQHLVSAGAIVRAKDTPAPAPADDEAKGGKAKA